MEHLYGERLWGVTQLCELKRETVEKEKNHVRRHQTRTTELYFIQLFSIYNIYAKAKIHIYVDRCRIESFPFSIVKS